MWKPYFGVIENPPHLIGYETLGYSVVRSPERSVGCEKWTNSPAAVTSNPYQSSFCAFIRNCGDRLYGGTIGASGSCSVWKCWIRATKPTYGRLYVSAAS